MMGPCPSRGSTTTYYEVIKVEVHTLENTDMFHAPVDATVKLLVRKEEAAVLHMTFEPGQPLPAHEVNENAAFYVIRGTRRAR